MAETAARGGSDLAKVTQQTLNAGLGARPPDPQVKDFLKLVAVM